MDRNHKQAHNVGSSGDVGTTNKKKSGQFTERVMHDEELGEENVELVDEEWQDFERALR